MNTKSRTKSPALLHELSRGGGDHSSCGIVLMHSCYRFFTLCRTERQNLHHN
ncbi:UNVERIFIED_CONTAM: hypothetical protein FKN15_005139 [Acipenser sinensis]